SLLYVITRPITPTLFPYTTLFRSCPLATSRRPHRLVRVRLEDVLQLESPLQRRFLRPPEREEGVGDLAAAVGGHQPAQADLASPDRKSTRLNSSHVKISYAVFCLK